MPDVVVPEQYFIPQGRIGDDAGGAIVLQGSLGDAQGLADLLGRKPPDSCRLGGAQTLAPEDVEGAPATLYRRSFP